MLTAILWFVIGAAMIYTAFDLWIRYRLYRRSGKVSWTKVVISTCILTACILMPFVILRSSEAEKPVKQNVSVEQQESAVTSDNPANPVITDNPADSVVTEEKKKGFFNRTFRLYWDWKQWDTMFFDHGGRIRTAGQALRVLILAIAIWYILTRLVPFLWKMLYTKISSTDGIFKKRLKKFLLLLTPLVISPRGFGINISILGVRDWRRTKRWTLKFPLLEMASFVTKQSFILLGKTIPINTAGHLVAQVPREVTGSKVDEPPVYADEERAREPEMSRGAEAQYKLQVSVYIDNTLLIQEQDPDLFAELQDPKKNRKNLLENLVFATFSGGALRAGQPRLLLEEGYLLPGILIAAAESGDEIVGEKKKGAITESARWEKVLEEIEIHPGSVWQRKLFLGDVQLGSKKHLMYVAKARPNSPLGRLRAMGLGVSKFELIDFNPEEDVLELFKKKTRAKLEREVNFTVLQQKIDSEHADRVAREQRAIGSARTVTAQIEYIRNWLFEATNGAWEEKAGRRYMKEGTGVIWNPTAEYVERLMPAFEFMRRWQHSSNSTILYGLGELIPQLGEILKGWKGGINPSSNLTKTLPAD